MKTILSAVFFLFFASGVVAQWENIAIPGSTTGITSMFTYGEALIVGTNGDGLFTTENNGSSWTDISGNIGNKVINDIRGGAGPQVIWVATESGIYFTQDHISYDNNTSTGLTTTDANYYWFGNDNNPSAEWAVGTNGGGVFISAELTGPWNSANTGISGDGLFVNDMGGYDDGSIDYSVLATEGGVYFSADHMASWIQKNNGLTGDALKVKGLSGLGSLVMIATRAGFYYSIDFGDNWTTLIPDEKFNTVFIYIDGTDIIVFVFGEKGFYTKDLTSFYPVELPDFPEGTEVTTVAANSTYFFIGTTSDVNDGKTGGAIYKRPVAQVITSIENQTATTERYNHLKQNFPNPAGSQTTISYILSKPDFVKLTISDILGNEISTLINEFQQPGEYSVEFDAAGLSGTIFFYTLQTATGITETRKMMVVH